MVCEKGKDEISVPVPYRLRGRNKVAMRIQRVQSIQQGSGSWVMTLWFNLAFLKSPGSEVTVASGEKKVLSWIEAYKMKPLPLNSLAEEIGISILF